MMQTTSKGCAVMLLSAATPFLLVLLFVASVLTPAAGAGAAYMAGSGWPCVITPTSATPAAPMSTPTATAGATGTCVDLQGNALVRWAVAIARHLHDCPPTQMDVCYDSGIPPEAIQWWANTCPTCSEWQNGHLQCVMFVSAVYGLSALPLYFGPSGQANAIQFWANYADVPNYVEIPTGWFDPAHAGLPAPGDMMIWWESFAPQEGHMAVVLAVTQPGAGHLGTVTIAEANGPKPILTETINANLTVNTWPGAQVVGFIRYVGDPPGTFSSGR